MLSLVYFLSLSFFSHLIMGLWGVMSCNIWIMIFQDIFFMVLLGLVFLMFMSTYMSSKEVYKLNFKVFLFNYIIFEVLTEIMFLGGYLLNISSLYLILIALKLNLVPFLNYKNLLKGLNFNFTHTKLMFLVYILHSKLWSVFVMFFVQVSPQGLILLVLLTTMHTLCTLKLNLEDLVMKSFVFSNIYLILMGFNFQLMASILYLFLSSFLQFKSLNIFKKISSKSCSNGEFFLTCLNGNPIMLFSWVKILAMLFVKEFYLLNFLMVSLVSSILLVNSFYFLNLKKNFVNNFNFKFMFIFLLFLTLVSLNENMLSESVWEMQIKEMYFHLLIFFNQSFNLTFLYEFFKKSEFMNVEALNFFSTLTQVVISFLMTMLFFSKLLKLFQLKDFEGVNYMSFNKFIIKSKMVKDLMFPMSILVTPMFILYVASYNFGSIYFSSKPLGYLNYFLLAVAFQWGWTNTLIKISPNYHNTLIWKVGKDFLNFFKEEGESGLGIFSKTFQGLDLNQMIFKGGFDKNILLLPLSSNILLKTSSLDVSHAWNCMELNLKMDSIKEKSLEDSFVMFSKMGEGFKVSCFEYCGAGHGNMSYFMYGVEETLFNLMS